MKSLLTMLITIGAHGLSLAEEPPPRQSPTADQLATSVLLYGRQTNGILQSTGFVVDAERGWVVTTWHFWSTVTDVGLLTPIHDQGALAVAPSIYLNRYFDGKAAKPKLVWYDSSKDLALIEVGNWSGARSVSLSPNAVSDKLALFALGNPASRNAMWEIEAGRVVDRKWAEWNYPSGQRIATNVFEFTVDEPLSTGFSGGPVFDARGDVVGMVIAAAKPDGLSVYAIPAKSIQRFIANGHAHLALKKSAVGEVAAARRHANLAIGYAAGEPWGYLARARLSLDQRRRVDAIEDWQSAWRLSPFYSLTQSFKTVGRSVGQLTRIEMPIASSAP